MNTADSRRVSLIRWLQPALNVQQDVRAYRRWLEALFLLAFLARLGALVVLGPRAGGDTLRYLQEATEIATTGVQAVLRLPLDEKPLYSLYLAAGIASAGVTGLTAALVGQSILGALTVLAMASLMTRATGQRTLGLVAGGIVAVHPTFLFWSVYLYSDTLFLLLLTLCFDRILRLERARHLLAAALLASIAAILVALARPTGAPFVLTLPVLLWILFRRTPRRLFQAAAGVGLPILLAAVLWFVRATPGAAPGDSLNDYVWSAVYFGLQWQEHGNGPGQHGRATLGEDIQLPPALSTMTARQAGEFFQSQSIGWIEADPGHFVANALRKTQYFWAPAMPEFSLSHTLIVGGYFLLFYALALAGFLTERRTILVKLCLVGVVTFMLTSAITFIDYDQRYRLPAELLLIPIVAFGTVWAAQRAAAFARRRRSLAEPARLTPRGDPVAIELAHSEQHSA